MSETDQELLLKISEFIKSSKIVNKDDNHILLMFTKFTLCKTCNYYIDKTKFRNNNKTKCYECILKENKERYIKIPLEEQKKRGKVPKPKIITPNIKIPKIAKKYIPIPEHLKKRRGRPLKQKICEVEINEVEDKHLFSEEDISYDYTNLILTDSD